MTCTLSRGESDSAFDAHFDVFFDSVEMLISSKFRRRETAIRRWSGKMHSPEPRTSMQGGEMDVLDKVKVAAGQASTKAKEGMATLQAKRKLTHAYDELGQTTFELVQSGELTHPRLSPAVERISAVKEELERAKRTEGPPSSTSTPGTPSESPTLPPR